MLTRRSKKGAQQIAATGGMMDEAGQVVNGVEVPAGSMAEEVADDVPAMLSEGEFVFPADVVRYVGLERLMKLRDKAKEGLERMEEMGQMGNAEEVENPDQQFAQADDIAFENEIDSIVGEVDGGSAAMDTERMFAAGGYVSGSDIGNAPKNPVTDVRYYKHADGRVMYITHINGRPMSAIPDGFKEVAAEEVRQVGKKADEAKQTANVISGGTSVGGSGGGGDAFDPSAGGPITSDPAPLGQTKGGSSYVQTNYNVTPKDAIKGILGMTTMNPILLAQAVSSIAKTKQVTTSPEYGKDVNAAAQAVASGQASVQGSPFASVEEAKAVAQYGFMSDEHLDAVIAAQEAALSNVNSLSPTSTANNLANAGFTDTGGYGSGIGDLDLSNVASTGMGTNPAGETVSNNDTIAAQNEALFGTPAPETSGGSSANDSLSSESVANDLSNAGYTDTGAYGDGPGGFNDSDSNSGGGGNDGTYCCSRMVHLGEWKQTKELTRMHIWHQAQPEWWKAGYSVWGKIVANTLFKKKGFWTDVMNAFYARHIKKQPRTLKSVIADLVIYPGVFVCGMIWRNAPETTRFVTEDEMK